MRRHRAFALAILVAVVLAGAAPASAALKVRVYRGTTSQDEVIRFRVAKTESGRRFLSGLDSHLNMTCDDATTQSFGFGYGFGKTVPITDGTFSFEDVDIFQAFRVAGRLGTFTGEGTLSMVFAALTVDEQAQLCTTGDLTWEAEYVRTITHRRIAPGATTLRLSSDTRTVLREAHS